MGKVDRLRNRVEPFRCPVLGLRLCTSQHMTLPVSPALLHRRTQSLYMVIAGSSLNVDAPAPPFPIFVPVYPCPQLTILSLQPPVRLLCLNCWDGQH